MQLKSTAVPMPGFVYMIGSDKYGWYKIGFSKNCEIRVDQLGILLPFKVELFAIWKSFDARSLEREMHDLYAHFHVHGEWFSLSENNRVSIIGDETPVSSSLIFPIGYVHKRPISASAERDYAHPKSDTRWKSDRNLAQKRRINAWIKERGLDVANPEHRRMAWAEELAAKKIHKNSPIDLL